MFNVNAIAENICEKNPKLVEWINDNEENYKPVRQAVLAVAKELAKKYNDGKFIGANDLHKLIWAVIDYAKGDVSPVSIEEI